MLRISGALCGGPRLLLLMNSRSATRGAHIESDMQEKRRADEERYVRERDNEALRKLGSQQDPSKRDEQRREHKKDDPFAVDEEKQLEEATRVPPT